MCFVKPPKRLKPTPAGTLVVKVRCASGGAAAGIATILCLVISFWHAIGSGAWLGDGAVFALGEVTSDEPFLSDHDSGRGRWRLRSWPRCHCGLRVGPLDELESLAAMELDRLHPLTA